MHRSSSPIACAVLVGGLLLGEAVARAQDVQQCIAANERSIALRRAGKLADALDALRTCAAEGCVPEVRAVCQQRIAEIHAALPSVVFAARDAGGRDLAAVKVSIDGRLLVDRLDGTAIVVDPGEHAFTFEVEGQPAVERRLLIREGEKDRHETVAFEGPIAPSGREGEGKGSHQATVGLGVGSAGVAAVIAGGVLGLMASAKWSDSKSACGAPGCDPAEHATAVSDHDSASGLALGSTIAFAAGGAAVAAGAVIFLTAPSGHPEAPHEGAWRSVRIAPAVAAQGAGLLLHGVFW
jgi:hypothetical protein